MNQGCPIEGCCFSQQAIPNQFDNMPDCFGEGIDWLVEQGKDPVI